jgi:hypothetical protein
VRNSNAVQASFRSGAGRMKDARKGRGGARNDQGDMLLEWEQEELEQQEPDAIVSGHEDP